MKSRTKLKALTLFILATLSKFALSENTPEPCMADDNVSFIINDIFDLTEQNSNFIHYWANFFHIKTKEKTLQNEAAFFLQKCRFTEADLEELERHLRGKKYIRDARVSLENDKVQVETWDNWSMMPTVTYGRKGGENKYAFGLKDRNLLGLGINTEFEYYSNDQRSGYKIESIFPLFLQNNIQLGINFTNNDDGKSRAVFLDKKFVSFNTRRAFKVGFNNYERVDTIFHQGIIASQYVHEQSYATAEWNWLASNDTTSTVRYGIGFTHEQHEFSPNAIEVALFPKDIHSNHCQSQLCANTLPDQTTTSFNQPLLPQNRAFNYPFVKIQFVQKQFKKLNNLHLINRTEDFNFGWDTEFKIGTDLTGNAKSPDLLWQLITSKGFYLTPEQQWFISAKYEGEIYADNDNNRQYLSLKNEYFHKLSSMWAGYLKNETKFSTNQFLDVPVELGGESGVRGYPLQYRHGQHSTQFTAEARYYPQINIYKLLELGAAAFIDTGRVFNPSPAKTQKETWLSSIGLGARFYSTHSSEARVIHLDLIRPLTEDPNVNRWEFRVVTKHSF